MNYRKADGFTIVELIVGVVVGALIVGGVSLIIANQVHIAQRGRDLVISNAYAERKVESIRSVGYLGLTNGTTDITSELPSELNPPKSGSLVISDFSTAVKKVDLTITYNDQGANRTYSYTTYVGELGVGQY